MAQRQGRRSLGLAPLPGLPTKVDNGLTEAQKFEDFRRRHSKQNKDIILDNVSRKSMIKGLQDDIAALHTELLEVRQANLILQAKIKRVQKDANKNILGGNGSQVFEALNQLISAFPALKQLRDNLWTTTALQEDEDGSQKQGRGGMGNGWVVENTYATRPAEVARQNHGLWSLVEASENGSESEREQQDSRKSKVKQKARHTGVGSIANSRSPRRSTQSPIVTYVEINSPSPSSSRISVSPSPRKAKQHIVGEKKQRRRRESGLITIPPKSPSPSPSPNPLVDEDVGEASEWEEGKAIELSPSDTNLNENISMPQDILNSAPSATRSESGSREVELMDTIREVSSSDSGSGSSSSRQRPSTGLPVPSEELGNVEEEGGIGRGRRSRSSVNYKEPSLSKKMRKPDGISTEEVLLSAIKPPSRKSLIPNPTSTLPPSLTSSLRPSTPRRKPSSSSSTSRSESPLPPVPASSEDIPISESRNTLSLAKQNGMRRKSALPNPANQKIPIERENKDEENDVDDLADLQVESELGLGYEDDLDNVQLRTEKMILNSPSKLRPSSVSSKKNNQEDIPPPNLPNSADNNLPLPKRTSSLSSASKSTSFRPTSATIASKTSSGLGLGRPIMPSSTTGSNIAGHRNITPMPTSHARLPVNSSSRKTEKEIQVLAEGDNVNIPTTTTATTRKVSGGDTLSKRGTMSTTRRRISAAI
ncbi:hypothetical protein V866_005780 [Kwoniella sp. B9012]|uniref:Shugoshin C-terminal domain-containing protein n=1 Tax=Kwoniella europaea PYCC6329 TaxID=1423913 RepID=A0AAX4KQ73_9TREE